MLPALTRAQSTGKPQKAKRPSRVTERALQALMSPRYAIGGRMVSGGNPSRQSILTNRASPVKLFAGEWLTRMRHITVQINGPVLSGSVYRVVIGDGHTSLSTEKTTLPQAIKLARQFNQKHRKNLAHVDYVGQEKKEETSK